MKEFGKGWQPARESVLVVLGFLILGIIFCYPAGFSDETLLGGDTLFQYLPYMQRAFSPISPEIAGPWDPTHFTGMPESHFPLSRYYPLTQILFRLFSPVKAFGLALILHYALAGIGAYLLIRSSGLKPASAWLGGITFAFGGFMVFHCGHIAMQYGGAWLPWIFWALERFRQTGKGKWIAGAASLLSLHALVGDVRTIVICGSAWVVYLLYYTATGTGTGLGRLRFSAGVVTICVLGALGSLPQLLPLLEVARWSEYTRFSLAFFAEGNLKFRYLVGLVSPWFLTDWKTGEKPDRFFGLTEHGIFFGVFALVLVLVAIFWLVQQRRKARPELTTADTLNPVPSRQAGFWLVLLLVNLAIMLGENLGLHLVLQFIPIYNLFHIPARHVLVFGMALAWLAAFGLEVIRQPLDMIRGPFLVRLGLTLVGLIILCVLSSLTMPGWPKSAPRLDYLPYWIALGSGFLAFGVVTLVLFSSHKKRLIVALLPLLVFTELWLHLHHYGLAKGVSLASLTAPKEFPEPIQWLREQGKNNQPVRYVLSRDVPITGQGSPNTFGSSWGLSSLNTYCNSAPGLLAKLIHLDGYGETNIPLLLAEERGFSAVGGKYIVTGADLPLIAPGVGFQLASLQQFRWYKNNSPHNPENPFWINPLATPTGQWEARPNNPTSGLYLIEGELHGDQPIQGNLRIQIAARQKRTTRALGEQTLSAETTSDKKISWGLVVDYQKEDGELSIQLHTENCNPAKLVQLNCWQLDPKCPAVAQRKVSLIQQELNKRIRQLYPVLVRLSSGCTIHVNPQARDLATLVTEVRPASTTQEAVEGILQAELPVKQLAFVVVPPGGEAELPLSGPKQLSPGTVKLLTSRADDLQLETTSKGEGFLVLAITHCMGWSATVDGEPVPLHQVDGPLMGLRVPAGTHVVRLQYFPVLVWFGSALAVLSLGGTWLTVFLASFYSKQSTLDKGNTVTRQGYARAA